MSLFEDLKAGSIHLADEARDGALAAGRAIKNEAVDIAHDPGKAAREAATWTYRQVIGNDIDTLMSHDPNVTTVDKVLAGISIASNFVGPEGRLIDKGLTVVAKEVLEHGGEELAAKGAVKLEESLGKDGVKALSKEIDHIAEGMKSGLEKAEKVIEGLNVGASMKKSLTETFDDVKATIGDFDKAIHAAGSERVSAWAKVAADIAKDGKDGLGIVQSGLKAKDLVHPLEPAKLAKLQKDATSTLLQEAERFSGDHGRTFVEGKDLVIDVRTSQNMTKQTRSMLATMHDDAQAAGKKLVVYDPQISKEQERTLLSDGISVAKSQMDLAKLSVASRATGNVGVELLNLDQRVRGSDLGQALQAKHEARETQETLAGKGKKNEKSVADKSVWTPDMPHDEFAALMRRVRGGQSRTQSTPQHELAQESRTQKQSDLSIGH